MSSFQNWRNYRGDGELLNLRTQEWRYRAVKEQKWTAPKGGLELGLVQAEGERREQRFLEEKSHRVWEQRGPWPEDGGGLYRSCTGRRQLVVSLKELPVTRGRPPPPFLIPIPPPSSAHPPRHFFPSAPVGIGTRHESHLQPREHKILLQHPIRRQPERREEAGQWWMEEEQKWSSQVEECQKCQEAKEGEGKKGKEVEEQDTGKEKGREHQAQAVDPDQEIVNEPNGFRICVDATGFGEGDFKVSIGPSRVLALDGEHVEDNGNGTVTIRKLNRRWKLAEDVKLHSVRAFLGADGKVEITGEKVGEEEEQGQQQEMETFEEEEGEGPPQRMAPPPPTPVDNEADRGSLQAMPRTPAMATSPKLGEKYF